MRLSRPELSGTHYALLARLTARILALLAATCRVLVLLRRYLKILLFDIIISAALVMQFKFWPWRSHLFNWSEVVSQALMLITTIISAVSLNICCIAGIDLDYKDLQTFLKILILPPTLLLTMCIFFHPGLHTVFHQCNEVGIHRARTRVAEREVCSEHFVGHPHYHRSYVSP